MLISEKTYKWLNDYLMHKVALKNLDDKTIKEVSILKPRLPSEEFSEGFTKDDDYFLLSRGLYY